MARRRIEREPETARIRDTLLTGQGVADISGKSAFVDGALTDEVVVFRRRRKRKGYDEAELLEIQQSSPLRVEPPCPNFLNCGGCSLQHMSADAQLEAKQRAVLDALERIGSVQPETALAPLAGRPLGYRRRARLGVRWVEKKGRVLVGFREKHSSFVADMHSCDTLKPELSNLIPALSDLIGQMKLRAQIPQVEVSMGDNAISLVFRVLETPGDADTALLREFGAQFNSQVWLQTGGPATVRPLDDAVVPKLNFDLPEFDLRLEFGPLDFIQVNQDMNRLMVAQAIQLVGPLAGKRVLDLFCGIGNFSLPLARSAESVVGVELDPVMVEKARENAQLNGLQGVEFHAADLTKSPEDYAWWQGGFDLVLLDPPRAGALDVLPQVAATGAQHILYVSCHPGSLARDSGILCSEYGYRLQSAGAMDMFPQTSHVEAMALFTRD